METHNGGHDAAAQGTLSSATEGADGHPVGTCNAVMGAGSACLGDTPAVTHILGSARTQDDGKKRRAGSKVPRGLTTTVASSYLQRGIWLRALLIANRFRVIRTIEISGALFCERPFKASLVAAQRAMRGLVKADLLRRYRTDRFQTVYGLTQKGAEYLEEAGFDAASSVRRVSDMTNPEHRLWAQFIVLASEARGIMAMSEQELLQHLNRNAAPGTQIQGLLRVRWKRGTKEAEQQLRPDAVAFEPDGLTAYEIDRSKRGADRETALAAMARSVGLKLKTGDVLRRVVVLCKTGRIEKRAIAVIERLAAENNSQVLVGERCHFRQIDDGTYEVWRAEEKKLSDGRTKVSDVRVGWVIVQMLPTWLPKVRVDSTNTHSMRGWFDENYLPYRRPASLGPWPTCLSPLLKPVTLPAGTSSAFPLRTTRG